LDISKKYEILNLVKTIDETAMVMSFFHRAGRIANRAVKENKKAWEALENLLDRELKIGEMKCK